MKTDVIIVRQHGAVMVNGRELCRGYTVDRTKAVIDIINLAWEHSPKKMMYILEEAMKDKGEVK